MPQKVTPALALRLDQWCQRTLIWFSPLAALILAVLIWRDIHLFQGGARNWILAASLASVFLLLLIAAMSWTKAIKSTTAPWALLMIVAVSLIKNITLISFSGHLGFSSNTAFVLICAAMVIKRSRIYFGLLLVTSIAWWTVATWSTQKPLIILSVALLGACLFWIIHIQLRSSLIRYEFMAIALEQHRQQLSDLVQCFPSPVFEKDHEGKFVVVNRAFCEFFRLKPDHFLGKTSLDVFGNQEIHKLTRTDSRTLKQGESLRREFRVQENGREYHFFSVIFPIRSDGNDHRVCGVLIDMSNERILETRFRELTNLMKDVFFIVDVSQAKLKFVSDSVSELIGYSADQVMRFPDPLGIMAKGSLPLPVSQLWATLKEKRHATLQCPLDHRDRKTIWIRVDLSLVEGDEPEVFGICSDISDEIAIRRKLTEQEQLFRQLAENVVQTFWLFDLKEDRFVYVNPTFKQLSGRTPESLTQDNRVFFSLFFPEDLESAKEYMRRGRAGESLNLEHRLRHIDGSELWVHLQTSIIHDSDGAPIRIVGLSTDITEQKNVQQKLEHLSQIDGLTGLANRRKFNEVIEREWKRLARTSNPLSLLMVDIDYFKKMNDKQGHQAGDWCLQQVAQTIGSLVRRPADLAARYGGEEFAVVLPETNAEGAHQFAESIAQSVQELDIRHPDSPYGKITVSVGVATAYPNPDQQSHALISSADQGLYMAKEQGRNRVVSSSVNV
ncbi:MAG: diguanylate cyclase [Acidobacteria bacterium]|nr:diguanylate cyclase [Acidobacteriota bacterium]